MSDTGTEDFVAANHGSFVLLRPVTEAARSWVNNHIANNAPVLAGRIAIELICVEGGFDSKLETTFLITPARGQTALLAPLPGPKNP